MNPYYIDINLICFSYQTWHRKVFEKEVRLCFCIFGVFMKFNMVFKIFFGYLILTMGVISNSIVFT